jgi:uncharacterized protein YjbI with pentapeptide repeats
MVRADLTAAVLMEADMKSVNMTGALVNGIVERRSFWCNTIYADGTLRNDDCQIGG